MRTCEDLVCLLCRERGERRRGETVADNDPELNIARPRTVRWSARPGQARI